MPDPPVIPNPLLPAEVQKLLDDQMASFTRDPMATLPKGTKHKGRTVGGPQHTKRDRTYRENAPAPSFRSTDLMVNFSGNVTANTIFHSFLSPAFGSMDKFVGLAPAGATISVKSIPKAGGTARITQLGPFVTVKGAPGPTIITIDKDLEVEEGGMVEFSSDQDGFVTVSAILHSIST